MDGETTSRRGMAALRDALTAPLGPHVDDETLALIVTAEAAGENVDVAYAETMAHIERCATCAASYGELAQMMFAAVADMDAAAGALAPSDVYTALLAQQLEREGLDASQAGRLANQAARNLPLSLSAAPQPESIDERWLAGVLPPAESPALVQPLARALRATASALARYMRALAEDTWARYVRFHDTIVEGWNRLPLMADTSPGARPSMVREAEPAWELDQEGSGRPLSLTIDARAERLDNVSCRLIINVDQEGKPPAAGRVVRLRAGSHVWEATTNEKGVGQVEPFPIASLSALMIKVSGD